MLPFWMDVKVHSSYNVSYEIPSSLATENIFLTKIEGMLCMWLHMWRDNILNEATKVLSLKWGKPDRVAFERSMRRGAESL